MWDREKRGINHTANKLVEDVNHHHSSIKLTSTIDNPKSFLDFEVKNIDNSLITPGHHEVATESYVILFLSDHPRHVFDGIIDCALLRSIGYPSK